MASKKQTREHKERPTRAQQIVKPTRAEQIYTHVQGMLTETEQTIISAPIITENKPRNHASGMQTRAQRYNDFFPGKIFSSSSGRVVILHPPSDVEFQNKLIEDCIWWCLEDDQAVVIDQFPLSRCFSPPLFWEISKTNDYFAMGEQIARYIIACRIQERTYSDIYDHNWVSKQLPLYTKEHRELFDAKLNSMKNNLSQVTVTMNKIPSSDMVPSRNQGKV